jgi:hypothetical protein
MDYAEESWPSKKFEPSVAGFKRAKQSPIGAAAGEHLIIAQSDTITHQCVLVVAIMNQ